MIYFLLFFLQVTGAAETDGFTSRYININDPIPELNQEINKRFDETIQSLNQKMSKVCDWDALDQTLGPKLRRPVYGEIEKFIQTSQTLPIMKLDIAKSIYSDLSIMYRAPIILGSIVGIGLTAHIHHNGLLIGADKFGHFFDEGYYYYSLVHTWKYSVDEALDFGSFLEETIDGLWTSGIYSHADLVANFEGFQFWKNALNDQNGLRQSKYFSCREGVWKKNQEFVWSDYVNEGWDEGMNCNRFRNEELKNQINQNIERLEKLTNKHFKCPVYPERVKAMKDRYAKYSNKLIFK